MVRSSDFLQLATISSPSRVPNCSTFCRPEGVDLLVEKENVGSEERLDAHIVSPVKLKEIAIRRNTDHTSLLI